MKKMAVVATISMLSLISSLKGVESFAEILSNPEAKVFLDSTNGNCPFSPRHVPFGSYFVDFTSEESPQTILLAINAQPPLSETVFFSGTNVNHGVTLSPSGDGIIVPKKGYYKIDWSVSVALVQTPELNYHVDLLKNGTIFLDPQPQAVGLIGGTITGDAVGSAAASVIVPLSKNDEISLLFTIDGSEGDLIGDGVEVIGAQISATWISSDCK